MDGSPAVDEYVGRSESWPEVISALRPILLDAGLDERIKWNKPCYCHGDANVLILQEMKDFLAVMFFKGALMADPEGMLVEQGPNSRSARRIELTSADQVERLSGKLASYVAEAITVEEQGFEVPPAPEPEWAAELLERLEEDPELRAGFESLTPGRRREYNIHIASAKRASTRESRVDRCAPRIRAGKGLRD